jgi:hypothetical protein
METAEQGEILQLAVILREMERLKEHCRNLERRLDSQDVEEERTEPEEGKTFTPGKTRVVQSQLMTGSDGQQPRVVVPRQTVVQQVPMSGDNGILDILSRATVKVPVLTSFDKSSVRRFIKEYEDYRMRFPMVAQPPQEFLRGDDLWYLSEFSGQVVAVIRGMDQEAFFAVLLSMFATADVHEAIQRLQGVHMSSDDLQLSTLMKYRQDWDFEVKCIGSRLLKQKVLVRHFVDGLRPYEFQKLVRQVAPDTVSEAFQCAMEVLPDCRVARERAKMFRRENEKESSSKKEHGKEPDARKSADSQTKLRNVQCFLCKGYGHIKADCPKAGGSAAPKAVSAKTAPAIAPAVMKRVVIQETIRIGDSEDIRSDGLRRMEVCVGDTLWQMLLDTGSNINVVSSRVVEDIKSLGIEYEMRQMRPRVVHMVASGSSVQLDGRVVKLALNVSQNGCWVEEEFYVMESVDEDFVLGLESMRKWDLIQCLENPIQGSSSLEDNFHEKMEEEVYCPDSSAAAVSVETLDICPNFPDQQGIRDVLEEHIEVFGPLTNEGMNVPPMEVKLKEGAQLKSQPCRFTPPHMMPKLKEELERLLRDGVIEPTDSANGASPLVLVQKHDGSIRMAVDYRQLNELLQGFGGSIPDMKSLFDYVTGRKFYAKMDNLCGYYQLVITEDDRPNTTITTPLGLYQFRKCPFGLSTAPGIYQDRMQNVVLNGLIPESGVVYIDDTVSYGNSVEEFLENLRKILGRMKEFGVKLKASKCSFGYSEVHFVGHVFSESGYRLSQEKKDEILELKEPNNLKELRRLLGLVNFFRDFIPHLSDIVKPLTDLTGSKGFKWSESCQRAWEAVKEAVANAGALSSLEPEGEITVYTDASTIGIGGVLKQFRKSEGREVPIMFVSQKFTDAARKWSTIEQECFAVYFVLLKLRGLLLGRKFVVATDHRNLVFLQSSTIPKLVRWRLRLSEFDFKVIHVPGKENGIADALSRMCLLAADKEESQEREASVKEAILSVHNSVVGHHGVTRTCSILKEIGVKINGMTEEVKKVILSCPVCQKLKFQQAPVVEKKTYTIQGSHPMRAVGVDAIGPLPKDEDGYQYILCIVDEFTKFAGLYPCKSVEAREYVQALMSHISLFGLMEQVRTDGASQFTARVCRDLMEFLGIKHHVIIPYHPQANGIVERRNGEVLKHLRAIIMEKRVHDKWSQYVPIVQNILNHAVDSSIGTYPSRILFGDVLKTDVEWIIKKDKGLPSQPVDKYVQQLRIAIGQIQEVSRQYVQAKVQAKVEKVREVGKNRVSKFDVGDYVLVTYPVQPPSKLSPIYRGPLMVVEKVRDDIVKCRDLVSTKLVELHVDRLREFKCSPDVNPEELLEWASTDKDEFVVEDIVEHRGTGKSGNPLEFRVRWKGYGPEEDTWLNYRSVNQLEALDRYERRFPDLLKYQRKKQKK